MENINFKICVFGVACNIQVALCLL